MFAQLAKHLPAVAPVSRRGFLRLGVGAGVGLTLGAHLPARSAAAAGTDMFTPFVRIGTDGGVTVIVKHLDKGQGTATGLATLVAEELDADWSAVTTEFAPANAELYNNLGWGPVQGTGGSSAIPNSWDQYRRTGATARAMLVEAAARRWAVPATEITVSQGVLSHGDRRLGFGDVAEAASTLPVPAEVALKTPDQWVLIGKPDLPRVDIAAKSTGAVGMFGLDHQPEGRIVAVLAKSPKFGGTLAAFDATEARAVPGVIDVIAIPQGVAVLAESTWPAIKARDLLSIDWDFSTAETRSTDTIRADYMERVKGTGQTARTDGDAATALASAATVVEQEFWFPFLAHAPMEPIDVTVWYDGTRATLRSGFQIQTLDHATAATVLDLDPADVQIETVWAGGSFGRRAIYDAHYTAEAATLARAWLAAGHAPRPIQLVYTREDDVRGGYYRPAYAHRVRAGLDADGRVVGWDHHIVGQSILTGTIFEPFLVHHGIDHTSVEGAIDATYAIPNLHLSLTTTDVKVPGLWWRAVGHTHTAYAVETMVDQLAHAAGRDPVEFRRELLAGDPRKLGVLDAVVEAADRSGAVPEGRARGVSVHKSFDTYVAQIAEVSVSDGRVTVERVWCAVDCGIAINPDNIRAQIEGGIGYGLGAILRNEITLTDGAVDQGNFDTYEPLRMEDMPAIEVVIVPSTESPTGVGEPGTPPIGPAVANAVFSATGRLPTALPFSKGGLV